MIIPWQQIDPEILRNIIESFVLREGTDYGEKEISFLDKVEEVRQQIACEKLVIVWSELHESVNIMPKEYFLDDNN